MSLSRSIDAAERGLLADRELQRRDAGAEPVLQLVERALERRALAVELVDEDRRAGGRARSASCHATSVCTSTPSTAETTNTARSATCNAARDVADEVGVAGRVDHVDLVAVELERRERERHRDAALRCSSGSKSQTVVPSSTRPVRGIAPAVNSRASASVVLPAPPWPTRATLRIFAVGNVFTYDLPGCACSSEHGNSWRLEDRMLRARP